MGPDGLKKKNTSLILFFKLKCAIDTYNACAGSNTNGTHTPLWNYAQSPTFMAEVVNNAKVNYAIMFYLADKRRPSGRLWSLGGDYRCHLLRFVTDADSKNLSDIHAENGGKGTPYQEQQASTLAIETLKQLRTTCRVDSARDELLTAEEVLASTDTQILVLKEKPVRTEHDNKVLQTLEEQRPSQTTKLHESQALVQTALDELKEKADGKLEELEDAETAETAKQIIVKINDKLRAKCAPYNSAYETYELETDPEQKNMFKMLELKKYNDVIEVQLANYLKSQDDADPMISLNNEEEITDIAEWIAESLSYVGQQSADRGINIDDKYRSDIKNVMKHVMSIGMCHWYYASNIMYYDARKQKYVNCRAMCVLHLGNEGGGCMIGSLVLFPTATCKRMQPSIRMPASACVASAMMASSTARRRAGRRGCRYHSM